MLGLQLQENELYPGILGHSQVGVCFSSLLVFRFAFRFCISSKLLGKDHLKNMISVQSIVDTLGTW